MTAQDALTFHRPPREYASYLRERDAELAQAGELQRGALARLYPDPGRLSTLLVKRANVWERRPDHRDFLHVRLGTGAVPLDRDVELDLGMNPLAEYQPHSLHEARKLVERRRTLRGEPVVVDLAEIGVLAVTGDRDRARAWARTLMNQLAAWRAPHDIRLLTAFAPEDAAQREWGKWLPHQRVDPNVPGRFLFARSPRELEALLEPEVGPRFEQLRRIAEADVRGRDVPLVAPERVVIVDGYRPDHPANDLPAFRELLMRARRLKAVLILLTDSRELEPSHVDAQLSVPERGPGAWELWGQDAPSIPEVFLDQVDLGTSEATARTSLSCGSPKAATESEGSAPRCGSSSCSGCRVPADRRLGGVQARVRGPGPRGRGAGRDGPQLRHPCRRGRQPLGRDPAGTARQPRHAARAPPARRIDSLVSRQAASSLPAEVPGRGLTTDGLHFQVALPRVGAIAEEAGTAAALGSLVADAAEHWSGPPAPPFRLLPHVLDPRHLPPPSARERAVRRGGARARPRMGALRRGGRA